MILHSIDSLRYSRRSNPRRRDTLGFQISFPRAERRENGGGVKRVFYGVVGRPFYRGEPRETDVAKISRVVFAVALARPSTFDHANAIN